MRRCEVVKYQFVRGSVADVRCIAKRSEFMPDGLVDIFFLMFIQPEEGSACSAPVSVFGNVYGVYV